MYQFFLEFQKLFVFKKWSNRKYSVFNSLGKMLRISVLLPAYLLSCFTGQAQSDTVSIDEIEIMSYRNRLKQSETGRIIYIADKEEIEALPVSNVQDLLEHFASIDLRKRGAYGVQADLSMRAGNFDQALILINGIKVNDAQTGHHNLNLPLSIGAVERVEILEGPGSRIFGSNAYSGAINIITRADDTNSLKLYSSYGQNNLFKGNISSNFGTGKIRHFLSINSSQSDGYLKDNEINNTDFKLSNAFLHSNYRKNDFKADLMLGISEKNFGANGFYSPKFPWQFENTQTQFGAAKIEVGNKNRFSAKFFYRRHQDRFELFREDVFERKGGYFVNGTDTAVYYPNVYADWNYYPGHNYHLTHSCGSELHYNNTSKFGKFALGAEYKTEQIYSNVLGENADSLSVPFEEYGAYTKFKQRDNFSLFVEHVYTAGRFVFGGGITSAYSPDYKWNFGGGLDANLRLNKKLKLFLALNRAYRLPTFTDLYYDGPTNTGNPDLKAETALTAETGAKYFGKNSSFKLSFYRRSGENTIDWGRKSQEDDWKSMNLTELTVLGGSFYCEYRFKDNLFFDKISASYAYADSDLESGEYFSNYAGDYLKHKAVFGLRHRIYKNFGASWQVRYEIREGTYTRYENSEYTEYDYRPYFLAALKLYWDNDLIRFSLNADNLTNTDYTEIGGVPMPGRWFYAGVSLKLFKIMKRI